MANEKISQMPLISTFASGDLFPIVDISEASAADRNKSVTFGELFRNVLGGSASAPSIAFTGDQNTGIYSPGADQVAISTAGSGRLFVDASGRVGVGTSSPSNDLDVLKTASGSTTTARIGATATSGANNATLILNNGGTGNATLRFDYEGSTNRASIGVLASDQKLTFGTAGSTAMTIDASQRVGVGTTSVSRLLHISAASGDTAARIQTATSGAFLEFQDSATTAGRQPLIGAIGDNLVVYTSAGSYSERARIDSSGRLGIGTSSPSSLLHVSGNNTTALLTVASTGTGAASFDGSGAGLNLLAVDLNNTNPYVPAIKFGSTDGAFTTTNPKYGAAITARAAQTYNTDTRGGMHLDFWTAPIDPGTGSGLERRMVIDSSGNVGIGNTDPSDLLTLEFTNNNSVTAEGLYINNINNGAGNNASISFSLDSGRRKKGAISLVKTQASYGAGDLVFSLDGGDSGTLNVSADEKMRLTNSGQLLVGTSTTLGNAETLQVNSTSPANVLGIYRQSNDVSGPRVLLGKTRGSETSIVQNNDTIAEIRFVASDGVDIASQAASITAAVDGTPGANDMPGRLTFSTTADGASSPTERMRIGSDGSMRQLTSGNSGFVALSTAAAGTTDILIQGVHSATTVLNGTISLRVYSNGNVQNTNGSYTTISDAKLKENITDAGSQWDDLKAIQIRNWNFKVETGHETHRQIGPIAQELETVCPGLVFETLDRDGDGNKTGEVTKGVNQSVLYMKAVKALQEAMERIETLEAKVAALEGQ